MMTELQFVAVCPVQRRQGTHSQKCWTFLFSRIPYLFSLLSPTSAQVLGSTYHTFIQWSVLIAVCEFVNKFLLCFFWTRTELQHSHVMIIKISQYVSSILLSFFSFQAQAEERGISTNKASLLLAVIGIANLVGRIILGYVSDKPWINRLLVYNVCLTICGLGECVILYIEIKVY